MFFCVQIQHQGVVVDHEEMEGLKIKTVETVEVGKVGKVEEVKKVGKVRKVKKVKEMRKKLLIINKMKLFVKMLANRQVKQSIRKVGFIQKTEQI